MAPAETFAVGALSRAYICALSAAEIRRGANGPNAEFHDLPCVKLRLKDVLQRYGVRSADVDVNILKYRGGVLVERLRVDGYSNEIERRIETHRTVVVIVRGGEAVADNLRSNIGSQVVQRSTLTKVEDDVATRCVVEVVSREQRFQYL